MDSLCDKNVPLQLNVIRGNETGPQLGVLHRNSLKFVRTAAVTPTHFELLQLSCSKPSYHFVLIYKPPASSVPGFLDEFENLVITLATTPGRQLILGDFNLHLDDPTSPGRNSTSMTFFGPLDWYNT